MTAPWGLAFCLDCFKVDWMARPYLGTGRPKSACHGPKKAGRPRKLTVSGFRTGCGADQNWEEGGNTISNRDACQGQITISGGSYLWLGTANLHLQRPYDGIPDTPRNRLLAFISE
jgi:hypothetical protein